MHHFESDRKASPTPPINVKVMGRMDLTNFTRIFSRQLPAPDNRFGNCRFILDWTAEEYDWLAVYHDIYRTPDNKGREKLRCPKDRTILITTEPSSITVYGTDYLRQYGTIITSQEPWAIKHPNVVFSQPGLIWFYGLPFNGDHPRTYDELKATPPMLKTELISTVCSSRTGRITDHSRRVKFTAKLKEVLPTLEIFGHGVRPMADKAEALDPFQYHIAVENHVYPHHLTEKLPDAFLGYTLPFYHGAPNAKEYFPAESFIPIDINNFTATYDIIRSTIANNEYPDRLPYIREARRRVLAEHNLFALLEQHVTANHLIHQPASTTEPTALLYSRQALRIQKPLSGFRGLCEKIIVKGRYHLKEIYKNLR